MKHGMKWKLFFAVLTALVMMLFTGMAICETAADGGSLTVYSFFDKDHNAECGPNEVAYTSLHVELLKVDGDSETLVTETDVTSEGVARFEGLEAGTYRIRTTCGAGYGYSKKSNKGKYQASSNIMQSGSDTVQTSGNLKITAGSDVEVGVAVRQMATVSGCVWLDADGDGVFNNGETGMAGAVLELKGTKNGLTYTLTTDETGKYSFSQVIPGSYKLYCTIPEGTAFTKYSEIGGTARSIFTNAGKQKDVKTYDLNDELAAEQQNIGVVRESKITGICYLDANYNGMYDEGEPALSGVKLELTKQSSSKALSTIYSEDDGTFSFGGLRGTIYQLRAVLPTGGYYYTKLSDGDKGNRFKYMEGRREYTLTDIKLGTEEEIVYYIGAVLPATITGIVYFDDDFSGGQNGKEAVCSGISVGLYDENGNRVDVAKSTAKGKFTFENVNPGNYYITATAKSGYAFTKNGDGNVLVNTGNGRGASEIFWISLGETKKGMDIGMILPGTVQGTVFADANDNGKQDSGETGLAGTVVSLLSEEGVAFTTTLDETGVFCFDAVMPGKYCVRYELPENSVFATEVSGSKPEGSTANTMWFDFATGAKVTEPVVGGVLLGSVSGTAFDDLDADGTNTETPMAGMTITLTPSRSDLEEVQCVTSEDGSFVLTALHPDTYTLTVTWPEGYVQSRTAGTDLPLQPGKNQQSAELTVAMGAKWENQLLGGVKPASLSGQMWLDANNNGILDNDEQGIAGEKIQVIDASDGTEFATLTTADDGSFSTSGMIPGSYRLIYTPDENTLPASAGDSAFTLQGDELVLDGIQLVAGDSLNGVLLGVVRYTGISGKVWVDRGGEIEAVEGAEITLSGAASASVSSDAEGNYTFDKLMPGDYQLSIVMPDGTVVVDADDSRLADGSLISVMKDTNGRSGTSDTFTLTMGHDLTAMDVGGVLPGRLGDFVWLDLNGNGLQDSGEGGIPGVTVTLIRNGVELESAITDQYGYYYFRNVYPSAYTLRVDYPAEVKPTVLRTDFAGVVSIMLEDGSGTAEISVESNKRNYNADMGFVLVTEGVYPAGYGEGAVMDWTVANQNDLRTN